MTYSKDPKFKSLNEYRENFYTEVTTLASKVNFRVLAWPFLRPTDLSSLRGTVIKLRSQTRRALPDTLSRFVRLEKKLRSQPRIAHPNTLLDPRERVVTQGTVLKRQEKDFVDLSIDIMCWNWAKGLGGPSSSSLLTSLISSPTFRHNPVGLCSLSCVALCERSSIIPSSPFSFPQWEDLINSLRRYDRTLQIGSQI